MLIIIIIIIIIDTVHEFSNQKSINNGVHQRRPDVLVGKPGPLDKAKTPQQQSMRFISFFRKEMIDLILERTNAKIAKTMLRKNCFLETILWKKRLQ